MQKKKNIIFLFSDQQRHDTVGCYGNKMNTTPNIDKMASEGVRFEHAFTCQPVCGPARSCLQTGLYATGTGCYRNGIALPLNSKTIAPLFNEAGYQTAYVGKWHLASTGGTSNEAIGELCNYRTEAIPTERRGGYKDYWMAADALEYTSHGYDGYVYDADMNKVEFKGFRADCITDFALDFLHKRNNEQPFFMFVSYLEPHHQNDRNVYEGPVGSKEKYKNYDVPKDLEGKEGDWAENYPDYLGCCNSLDHNVGRIMNELEKLGIKDDTIIFYTSDHGSHFKTRNSEYKRSCHESSIRIPMVALGADFKGGKVIDELVSLIDIPSTLLACAEVQKPEYMKGRPLQDLVSDNCVDWNKEVFIQISESEVARAIRTQKWKYCVAAPDKDPLLDGGSDTYIEKYLYDLENDPYEKNNLVGKAEYREISDVLKETIKRRIVDAGEKEPQILVLI